MRRAPLTTKVSTSIDASPKIAVAFADLPDVGTWLWRFSKIMLKFSASVSLSGSDYVSFLVDDGVDAVEFLRLKTGTGTDFIINGNDVKNIVFHPGQSLKLEVVGLNAGSPTLKTIMDRQLYPDEAA